MEVLRGAVVVDGTGAPGRPADVVIDGGLIAEVAPPGEGDGDVVDLDGLVLAPGFIDCHTHYDAQVLWDRDLTPSSWHGVTTAVMGNCGFGIAPTSPEHRDLIVQTLENVEGMPADALRAGIPWTFESFPDYLDALDAAPTRLNVAAMVGHTPLRIEVMGEAASRRAATDGEVARMRALVLEALDSGAIGFATSRGVGHIGAGGLPVPSRLAEVGEVFALAGALGERGKGTIAVTYGPGFSVEELAQLSLATGRPVTWTALGTGNPDMDPVELLERHRAAGGEVYPQVACRPVVMQAVLAEPAQFAYVDAFRDVLAAPAGERRRFYEDEGWRARARADFAAYDHLWPRISVQETERHAELVGGPSLAELAATGGVHPLDVLCDLSLAEDLRTRFRVVLFNDDEEQLAELLRSGETLLGLSDAGAHVGQLCDAVFSTHLLEHWVRETGVLTLEQAVWRLTTHPAHVYRIADRGQVRPGLAADLVAFDPDAVEVGALERVADLPAGAERLVARSRGYERTWVNGVSGEARAGRLLRS